MLVFLIYVVNDEWFTEVEHCHKLCMTNISMYSTLTEDSVYVPDVMDLAWSPHDAWLSSCSIDNTVVIWNALKFPGEFDVHWCKDKTQTSIQRNLSQGSGENSLSAKLFIVSTSCRICFLWIYCNDDIWTLKYNIQYSWSCRLWGVAIGWKCCTLQGWISCESFSTLSYRNHCNITWSFGPSKGSYLGPCRKVHCIPSWWPELKSVEDHGLAAGDQHY